MYKGSLGQGSLVPLQNTERKMGLLYMVQGMGPKSTVHTVLLPHAWSLVGGTEVQWPRSHCPMLNSQGLRELGRVSRIQEWEPLWVCRAVAWQEASAGTKGGPELTLKQTLFLSCALATLTATLASGLGSPCTEQGQTRAREKRHSDQAS